MDYVEILAEKVLNGESISKDEAMKLYAEPLENAREKPQVL